MRFNALTLFSVLAIAKALPDGRIPEFFTQEDFDNANLSPYSTEFVKGDGIVVQLSC